MLQFCFYIYLGMSITVFLTASGVFSYLIKETSDMGFWQTAISLVLTILVIAVISLFWPILMIWSILTAR